MYPENTMLAFEKAAAIDGLTGIELDIQLTKDDHIVVMHDEWVNRTTDGNGRVVDFTLEQIKKLKIKSDTGFEQVPTIEEVLDLLAPRFKVGFKLNIELKNSDITYVGMEEKIIDVVHRYGAAENIVYSSFSAASIARIKQIDKNAKTGILDTTVSNCFYAAKGGCGADALHPYWQSIDMTKKQLEGYTVRAWLLGHLYPEKPTGNKLDLSKLEEKGITDVFLNEPERYLNSAS